MELIKSKQSVFGEAVQHSINGKLQVVSSPAQPQVISNLRIMPKTNRGNCSPRIDGVLINPETGDIAPVKGFIKISEEIVLEPTELHKFQIGHLFFYSRQDALRAIISSCERSLLFFNERINELKTELEKTEKDQFEYQAQSC